jgi:formylglycine-generating enzyme required for sulfatase activity
MPALTSRVLTEFQAARAESDRLFRILKDDALYDRPIAERHRVIFYVGHLDCFDFIHICRNGMGLPAFDAAFDELFQAGIDPDSSQLPCDQPADWPALERIQEYSGRCRQQIDKVMDEAPEDALQLALEHRLMHLETLAYMFHNFGYDRKRLPAVHDSVDSGASVAGKWCEIPAGEAVLGMARGERFGWDNEFEKHRVYVPAFRMQRFAVTNGEYLEFVKEGAAKPNFWVERHGNLWLRGMFQEIALPLNWPVYVTQREAAAYAFWKGLSVATEAEYHRAAAGAQAAGNYDFRRWDPEPVDASPEGDSFFGVSQLVGNGWEWTSTPFGPFPGFEPRASYPGYSANFFDGEHFVMKGAASRTAARLTRASFRNWFRRDYPYVYAKFRCVQKIGN